jgi:hypothetical protein
MESIVTEDTTGLNYFITADAGYCHVLPENIIVTTHTTFSDLPPSEDKRNTGALLLGVVGVTFGTFLMVNFFIVGFYLMGLLFFLGMFYATKALADVARYSTIKNIERKDIDRVNIYKPYFGYTFLLIRFRNAQGKTSLKKIKLYDSQQNEIQAVRLLKTEGLI